MRLRTVLVTLPVACLLAGSAAAVPAGARASGCVIRDFSPHEIVIGAEPSRDVQFSLDTTCPVEADVNWYVTVHNGPPGPYGWLMRANFFQSPGTRYSWAHDGVVRVERPPNAYTGPNDISFGAFLGDTGHARNSMRITGTVLLKHGTQFRFNGGIDVVAEPATVPEDGTVTLRSRLERANWDAGPEDAAYDGYPAPVVVEFRAEGNAKYQAVKTVRAAADGAVTATVTAKRTGTWRLRFAGDDVSGATKSSEDYVSVTK